MGTLVLLESGRITLKKVPSQTLEVNCQKIYSFRSNSPSRFLNDPKIRFPSISPPFWKVGSGKRRIKSLGGDRPYPLKDLGEGDYEIDIILKDLILNKTSPRHFASP